VATAYDVAAELEVQDADYDTTLVQRLALSYRGGDGADPTAVAAGAPAAEMTDAGAVDLPPAGAADPEGTDDALECLRAAFPTLSGGPIRLIAARFEGTPAYLGLFLTGPGAGQPPDTATVWVAARHDCSILSSTQASLSA
jgi:hypothetical protein